MPGSTWLASQPGAVVECHFIADMDEINIWRAAKLILDKHDSRGLPADPALAGCRHQSLRCPQGGRIHRSSGESRLELLARKMDAWGPATTMTQTVSPTHTELTWIRNDIGLSVASKSGPSILHPIANRVRSDGI